jgi:hypothetical protein
METASGPYLGVDWEPARDSLLSSDPKNIPDIRDPEEFFGPPWWCADHDA